MKVKVFTIFCAILLTIGCSKNDDTVEETQVEKPEEQELPNEPTSVTVLTGKFIDGAVQGLTFETATQEGVTNADGEFNYVEGEEITFKVGEVVLGSVVAKVEITPIDIAQVTDEGASIASKHAHNIASFLQTLDSDGDESNGISISDEVGLYLGISSIDFTSPIEAILGDIVLNVVQNSGIELNLVYPSDAANNMAVSLGIDYVAPENMHVNYLEPSLKTLFQTTDNGSLPSTAFYKNTFDLNGNILLTEIKSRYSEKMFYSIEFYSHYNNGLPQTGKLTSYSASSIYGGSARFPVQTSDIDFGYDADNHLNLIQITNENGNIQRIEFTSFNEVNRPLSFVWNVGYDNSELDFTIAWSFTYVDGLISTAKRLYDYYYVADSNNIYETITTRDFVFTYNEFKNKANVDFTRVFEDNNVVNGEMQNSRSDAMVNEVYTYSSNQKLERIVTTEVATPSVGETINSTVTLVYDSNELLESYDTSSTNGYVTSSSFNEGVEIANETYYNGLLVYFTEYFSDGTSLNIYNNYFGNGEINYKVSTLYGVDGILTETTEYYYSGEVDYTDIDEYDGYSLVKSSGYNSTNVIQYTNYFNEAGYVFRADIYFEGQISYYDIYVYDSNGFRIQATSHWPDGEAYGIRNFVYNSLGYLDTITYSFANGEIYLTDVYQYDENNYLSQISGYGANGNISYIVYYENGLIVLEEIYDENGVLVEVNEYNTSGKSLSLGGKVNIVQQSKKLNSNLNKKAIDTKMYRTETEFKTKKNSYGKVISPTLVHEQRVSKTIKKIRGYY